MTMTEFLLYDWVPFWHMTSHVPIYDIKHYFITANTALWHQTQFFDIKYHSFKPLHPSKYSFITAYIILWNQILRHHRRKYSFMASNTAFMMETHASQNQRTLSDGKWGVKPIFFCDEVLSTVYFYAFVIKWNMLRITWYRSQYRTFLGKMMISCRTQG